MRTDRLVSLINEVLSTPEEGGADRQRFRTLLREAVGRDSFSRSETDAVRSWLDCDVRDAVFLLADFRPFSAIYRFADMVVKRESYRDGYDRCGVNAAFEEAVEYSPAGYDACGFDRDGYDSCGFNMDGYNRDGRDRLGYDCDGFNSEGYDRNGYDREGYDRDGFNSDGLNRSGYDRDGYDREGYDRRGLNRLGRRSDGYDQSGYDLHGYNSLGRHHSGESLPFLRVMRTDQRMMRLGQMCQKVVDSVAVVGGVDRSLLGKLRKLLETVSSAKADAHETREDF